MAGTLLLWLLLVVPIAMQVPLLWFAMRHIEIEEAPTHLEGDLWGEDGLERREKVIRRAREPGSASGRTAAGETRAVRCPQCGAENEPGFRYCENCVTRL